ncbi:hypothetical protein AX774_g3850 [Zancudomyces culisetae]|uniref:Uncharacterized protein n=1 Tax=Zancudomyces culisetae TaxID=1213189 RepID=A0A1R1PP69_ZANCU|nr:hypothetical protein AX774_g6773 [Zancudomyces culisetae]OMH82672.1 hypothetical protein AX774_g3850 [Zancudomyces culisetae]|eukprot:OMH79802.1 hypothetical protein AX774_g6773 [Zancudomyces culisetae]
MFKTTSTTNITTPRITLNFTRGILNLYITYTYTPYIAVHRKNIVIFRRSYSILSSLPTSPHPPYSLSPPSPIPIPIPIPAPSPSPSSLGIRFLYIHSAISIANNPTVTTNKYIRCVTPSIFSNGISGPISSFPSLLFSLLSRSSFSIFSFWLCRVVLYTRSNISSTCASFPESSNSSNSTTRLSRPWLFVLYLPIIISSTPLPPSPSTFVRLLFFSKKFANRLFFSSVCKSSSLFVPLWLWSPPYLRE